MLMIRLEGQLKEFITYLTYPNKAPNGILPRRLQAAPLQCSVDDTGW